MNRNYKESVFSILPHDSRLTEHEEYTSGYIMTERGIVGVYSQDGFTSVSFVRDGHCYNRNWDKRYSNRVIITLAKQIAKEITEWSQALLDKGNDV